MAGFFGAVQLPLDFGNAPATRAVATAAIPGFRRETSVPTANRVTTAHEEPTVHADDTPPHTTLQTDPATALSDIENAQSSLSIYERRGQIETLLAAVMGSQVRLVITNNCKMMLSSQDHEGARTVRLHHMFLRAEDSVIAALATYLTDGDRDASRLLDGFIQRNRTLIRVGSHRAIQTQGRHHDLDALRTQIVEDYFGGDLPVAVTWGRSRHVMPSTHVPRSVRLGHSPLEGGYVSIHRVLDHPDVPSYVVAWVIYHELLHHVVPSERVEGRMRHHGTAFLAREKQFLDLDRAMGWQRAHLSQLLSPCGQQ